MGNELKLSLENFQSIAQGELTFHTGTNVIIGQSNSGKTATFRALKACLSNPAGSQRFIKKGTNHASVTLEYNGNQIVWNRTPKESSYTINGENFIKTGKSNAFKIIEDTGFVVDSNDVIMNIEEELQLPFPFGIPKSELFKLYEDVFCVSDSAIILKAAKEKEESVKSQISDIENNIIKNKNKLSEIENFKKEVDIQFLESKKKGLTEKMGRLMFLRDGLDTIHIAQKTQTFRVDEETFEDKVRKLSNAVEIQQKLEQLKKLHKVSKDLKDIAEPKPKELRIYEELKELKRAAEVVQSLSNVEAPIQEFDAKLQKYEELEELRKIIKKAQGLRAVEVPMQEFINKLQKYRELRAYSEFFKNLKEQGKQKKEKLEVVNDTITRIEEDLKRFKVCPLCHQPINN